MRSFARIWKVAEVKATAKPRQVCALSMEDFSKAAKSGLEWLAENPSSIEATTPALEQRRRQDAQLLVECFSEMMTSPIFLEPATAATAPLHFSLSGWLLPSPPHRRSRHRRRRTLEWTPQAGSICWNAGCPSADELLQLLLGGAQRSPEALLQEAAEASGPKDPCCIRARASVCVCVCLSGCLSVCLWLCGSICDKLADAVQDSATRVILNLCSCRPWLCELAHSLQKVSSCAPTAMRIAQKNGGQIGLPRLAGALGPGSVAKIEPTGHCEWPGT